MSFLLANPRSKYNLGCSSISGAISRVREHQVRCRCHGLQEEVPWCRVSRRGGPRLALAVPCRNDANPTSPSYTNYVLFGPYLFSSFFFPTAVLFSSRAFFVCVVSTYHQDSFFGGEPPLSEAVGYGKISRPRARSFLQNYSSTLSCMYRKRETGACGAFFLLPSII